MKIEERTIVGRDQYGNPVSEKISVPVYSRWERFVKWFRYYILRKRRFKKISSITVESGGAESPSAPTKRFRNISSVTVEK